MRNPDVLLYEKEAWASGFLRLAGIDEAGRGPLAGPVVAAAVILPQGCALDGVRDSKQMTPKAREAAFPVIQEQALSTGIGVVSREYIDEHNILKAALEAMRRAILTLAIGCWKKSGLPPRNCLVRLMCRQIAYRK